MNTGHFSHTPSAAKKQRLDTNALGRSQGGPDPLETPQCDGAELMGGVSLQLRGPFWIVQRDATLVLQSPSRVP